MTLHPYCVKITQKIAKMPDELCRIHITLWGLITDLGKPKPYEPEKKEIFFLLEEAEKSLLDASSLLHRAYLLGGEILIEGEGGK